MALPAAPLQARGAAAATGYLAAVKHVVAELAHVKDRIVGTTVDRGPGMRYCEMGLRFLSCSEADALAIERFVEDATHFVSEPG